MAALEKFLDKFLSPVATFMSNSLFFATLSEAFMRTTPVTLGASILMIIGNFPVPGWTDYLTSVGLYVHFIALQGATLNIIGVFVAFFCIHLCKKKQTRTSCCWVALDC